MIVLDEKSEDHQCKYKCFNMHDCTIIKGNPSKNCCDIARNYKLNNIMALDETILSPKSVGVTVYTYCT